MVKNPPASAGVARGTGLIAGGEDPLEYVVFKTFPLFFVFGNLVVICMGMDFCVHSFQACFHFYP